jgi:hypothetical protein
MAQYEYKPLGEKEGPTYAPTAPKDEEYVALFTNEKGLGSPSINDAGYHHHDFKEQNRFISKVD